MLPYFLLLIDARESICVRIFVRYIRNCPISKRFSDLTRKTNITYLHTCLRQKIKFFTFHFMFNNAQDRCSIMSLGLFVLESLSNNDLDGHENALLQLSRLLHLVHFVKCWQFFLELNSKRLSQCLGKEIESRCPVFPSSKKREIGSFTSQQCSDGKLKTCTKKRAPRVRGTQRGYSSKPLNIALVNAFQYSNGRYRHIFIP